MARRSIPRAPSAGPRVGVATRAGLGGRPGGGPGGVADGPAAEAGGTDSVQQAASVLTATRARRVSRQEGSSSASSARSGKGSSRGSAAMPMRSLWPDRRSSAGSSTMPARAGLASAQAGTASR